MLKISKGREVPWKFDEFLRDGTPSENECPQLKPILISLILKPLRHVQCLSTLALTSPKQSENSIRTASWS